MTTIKEGLKYVAESSVIIAAICTIIMLIAVLSFYKLGYFEYNNENMLKIVLGSVIVFGTVWFIADTILTWKDNMKREDEGINKFVESEAQSEKEKKGLQENNQHQNGQIAGSIDMTANNNAKLNKNTNKCNKDLNTNKMIKESNTKITTLKSLPDDQVIMSEIGLENDIAFHKEEINNILREPINQAPEYRYISKNKIQIPGDIDVYLDRGNF